MKTVSSILILFIITCVTHAQIADTIVTMRGKIIGYVKEVTPDVVAYSNPNETVVYKIEKGAVARICFASGRVEEFADLKTLANLNGAYEWEKVEVATTEYETKGLYKIDLVSTKATGATVYSSVSHVQNRAIAKLKMATALLGGNLVYIKSESIEGNIRSENGERTTRTQILGTAYCSNLVDEVKFKELMEGGQKYTLINKLGLRNNDADIQVRKANNEPVNVVSFNVEKGFIYANLLIAKEKSETRCRVLSFSETLIVVAYKEGTAYYNLILAKR